MTDEANSHYFAIISQLIEGHEWIRNHIGEGKWPSSSCVSWLGKGL